MIELYVCYHKPYPQIESKITIPIHVGKALSGQDLGFVCDNTGDNISAKNPYFCELTATYWAWKNSTSDIIGLFHYRRFLNFSDDETKVHELSADFALKYGITTDNIQNTLKEYDLILPRKTKKTKISVYDHYCREHIGADIDLVLEIIKRKYPADYDVAERELKNNSQMYVGNMLIAKKEVFDIYAAWLFDILFEVEKKQQTEVLKRDTYQQRVYGFLAERLTGIFVATHADLKVKEIPMLFVEENIKKYRKYCFRRFKQKILQAIGLRKKTQ